MAATAPSVVYPIVCPLDGRRSTSTVIAKLLFSYLTNAVALWHLTDLRNEPFPDLQLLVLVTAPLSIALNLVISLLYILTSARRHKTANAREFIEHHLALLLYTNVRLDDFRRRALSSPPSPFSDHPKWISTKRLSSKRVSFTIVLLFKCFASILLYLRRRANAAATLADIKLFQVACGGSVTGFLTLIYLAEWPSRWYRLKPPSDSMIVHHSFKDPVSPQNPETKFTSIDVVLAVGRDIWLPPGFVPSEQNPWTAFQLYYSGAISFITQVLTKLCSGYTCAIFFGTTLGYSCPLMSDIYEAWSWLSLIIGVPIGFLLAAWFVPSPFWKHLPKYIAWTTSLAVLWPFWFPVVFGILFGPVSVYQDYIYIYNETVELSKWPLDKPCPMLWTDPIDGLFGWLVWNLSMLKS